MQARKRCPKCDDGRGKYVDMDDFYNKPTKHDGLEDCCKTCFKERVRRYQRSDGVRELIRKQELKYRHSDAGKETINKRRVERYWKRKALLHNFVNLLAYGEANDA